MFWVHATPCCRSVTRCCICCKPLLEFSSSVHRFFTTFKTSSFYNGRTLNLVVKVVQFQHIKNERILPLLISSRPSSTSSPVSSSSPTNCWKPSIERARFPKLKYVARQNASTNIGKYILKPSDMIAITSI